MNFQDKNISGMTHHKQAWPTTAHTSILTQDV